jgi:hypothetical protein
LTAAGTPATLEQRGYVWSCLGVVGIALVNQGSQVPFRAGSDPAFDHDVQHHVRRRVRRRECRAHAGLGAWVRPLFGEVTGQERGLVPALLIIAGTGLSFLRQTGTPAWDTIWAEDGARFLTDALALPAWQSIPRSYAGYLHLLPRAVGELVAALPLAWASAVIALTAAGLVAAMGALCFVATGGHLRSVAARVCIALSVTLTPTASFEVLNSVALSQFPLTFAVFWVLLWRPRGRFAVAVGCVTALVGALSAPLTAALVPLAIVRLLALRSWPERLPALIVIIGSAIQVAVTLSQSLLPQAAAPPGKVTPVVLLLVLGLPALFWVMRWRPFRKGLLLMAFGMLGGSLAVILPQVSDLAGKAAWIAAVRVALGAVAGTQLAMTLWRHIGPESALAAGAALLVVGAFALGRPAASRHTRLLVAVTGAYAAGFAFLPLFLRGEAGTVGWTAEVTSLAGARYVYVPILLVVCLVAIALDERPRMASPAWWWGVRAVALMVLAVPVVLDLRVPNLRSQGPRWSTEVSQAAAECRELGGEALVEIDHPPNFGGVSATVPCSRL